jgi:TonB family protein
VHRDKFVIAAVLSVALHALGVYMAVQYALPRNSKLEAAPPEEHVIRLEMVQIPPPRPPAVTPPERPDQTLAQAPAPKLPPARAAALQAPRETVAAPPPGERPLTSMNAPPAPTAQEWAAAGQYTLKNSKRYRYTWGQQVRSMMGTAIEGPDQGMVRFRVEIYPDGTLARLETLWSTSAVAEQLARKAVENMPPLPPTPTGKPLVFETTVSFQPFDAGGPPIYKYDCLPDPPAYGNPFVWNGKSPQVRVAQPSPEKLDPQAVADCLKQLPQDTIEAESAHNQRQLEQWGSSKLGR